MPSAQLSEAEIAAAALADQGQRFNPQQQFPVTWPAHPMVARAYVDQLRRSNTLTPAVATELTQALTQATGLVEANAKDAALAGRLQTLSGRLGSVQADAAATKRRTALQESLKAVAQRLR